jgi:hypothetical protein
VTRWVGERSAAHWHCRPLFSTPFRRYGAAAEGRLRITESVEVVEMTASLRARMKS